MENGLCALIEADIERPILRVGQLPAFRREVRGLRFNAALRSAGFSICDDAEIPELCRIRICAACPDHGMSFFAALTQPNSFA